MTPTITAILASVAFGYGEPCESLDWLDWEDLKEVAYGGNRLDNARFCNIESPEECSDFAPLVDEFGELLNAMEPGYCRFVPWPKTFEAVPDHFYF